jgi:hypothetical protein
MHLQMQKIPDLEKLNLKDITSYGGAMQHGEERAHKHDKAASLYNHVSRNSTFRCNPRVHVLEKML